MFGGFRLATDSHDFYMEAKFNSNSHPERMMGLEDKPVSFWDEQIQGR